MAIGQRREANSSCNGMPRRRQPLKKRIEGEAEAHLFDRFGPPSVTLEAGEKQTETDADIMGAYSAERRAIMADKSLSKAQRKSKIAAAKVRRNLDLAARKARRKSDAKRPTKKVKLRDLDRAA
jgi:hypothetical protein